VSTLAVSIALRGCGFFAFAQYREPYDRAETPAVYTGEILSGPESVNGHPEAKINAYFKAGIDSKIHSASYNRHKPAAF
jgi:hypothetical protein